MADQETQVEEETQSTETQQTETSTKTEIQEETEVKSPWPENWREIYATGKDGKVDENRLGRLSRYASPQAAFDAMISAQDKIRSGEHLKPVPFPDKGTDEEKAAWRKDQGLPDSPENYDLTFEDGLVIGEDDQPVIDDFLQYAHGKNIPNETVKDAVRWYKSVEEKMSEQQNQMDIEAKTTAEDTMRAEWGQEYRPNINRIGGMLDLAPEGLKDRLLNGRLADGTPIGSDPDAMRWLVQLANDINPVGTLTPGVGTTPDKIEDRIAQIEIMMKVPRGTVEGDKYWKNEKLQEEYRNLLDARNRVRKRA